MKSAVKTDIAVLGAGAAGLMCALTAGRRGRKVTVLERNDRPGKKIRISGGGRCNFTNLHAAPDRYLSANPHFATSALSRFTAQDFIRLVRKHNIAYHEKKLGQLFCDGSAQQITDMLLAECARAGVTLVTGTEIREVTHAGGFGLRTSKGDWTADSLVIATGGLSVPPLGATDFGYRLAKQFGLKIIPCRPGLVPVTFSGNDLKIFRSLSGVSVPAVARFGNHSFEENILFTHRGLSGPAVLQISSYWQPGKPLVFDLLPGQDPEALLKANTSRKTLLKNYLAGLLPARLAETLTASFLTDKPLNQCSAKDIRRTAELLSCFTVIPKGTEGFAKAEVTAGGVDTDELSSKTMEAKKIPGLFFIGEVVDVTGHLGGYNFQWAWSSGRAAGEHA